MLTLLVGLGAAGWMLFPEPEPPPEPVVVEDEEGMTDEETEELMRTIGYVQQ